MPLDCCRWR